jgi:hypothetical protein
MLGLGAAWGAIVKWRGPLIMCIVVCTLGVLYLLGVDLDEGWGALVLLVLLVVLVLGRLDAPGRGRWT